MNNNNNIIGVTGVTGVIDDGVGDNNTNGTNGVRAKKSRKLYQQLWSVMRNHKERSPREGRRGRQHQDGGGGGGAEIGQLFERHLDDICHNGQLPDALTCLLECLWVHGVHTDGVFRHCPNVRKCRQLRDAVDAGNYQTLSPDTINPHVAASLLKELLRSLPDCVLSCALYSAWLQTTTLTAQPDIVHHMTRLVSKLSANQQLVLRHVIAVLHRISQSEHETRMTSSNLGICVGPSLLWQRRSSMDHTVAGEDPGKVALVVKRLIDLNQQLFDGDWLCPFSDVTAVTSFTSDDVNVLLRFSSSIDDSDIATDTDGTTVSQSDMELSYHTPAWSLDSPADDCASLALHPSSPVDGDSDVTQSLLTPVPPPRVKKLRRLSAVHGPVVGCCAVGPADDTASSVATAVSSPVCSPSDDSQFYSLDDVSDVIVTSSPAANQRRESVMQGMTSLGDEGECEWTRRRSAPVGDLHQLRVTDSSLHAASLHLGGLQTSLPGSLHRDHLHDAMLGGRRLVPHDTLAARRTTGHFDVDLATVKDGLTVGLTSADGVQYLRSNRLYQQSTDSAISCSQDTDTPASSPTTTTSNNNNNNCFTATAASCTHPELSSSSSSSSSTTTTTTTTRNCEHAQDPPNDNNNNNNDDDNDAVRTCGGEVEKECKQPATDSSNNNNNNICSLYETSCGADNSFSSSNSIITSNANNNVATLSSPGITQQAVSTGQQSAASASVVVPVSESVLRRGMTVCGADLFPRTILRTSTLIIDDAQQQQQQQQQQQGITAVQQQQIAANNDNTDSTHHHHHHHHQQQQQQQQQHENMFGMAQPATGEQQQQASSGQQKMVEKRRKLSRQQRFARSRRHRCHDDSCNNSASSGSNSSNEDGEWAGQHGSRDVQERRSYNKMTSRQQRRLVFRSHSDSLHSRTPNDTATQLLTSSQLQKTTDIQPKDGNITSSNVTESKDQMTSSTEMSRPVAQQLMTSSNKASKPPNQSELSSVTSLGHVNSQSTQQTVTSSKPQPADSSMRLANQSAGIMTSPSNDITCGQSAPKTVTSLKQQTTNGDVMSTELMAKTVTSPQKAMASSNCVVTSPVQRADSCSRTVRDRQSDVMSRGDRMAVLNNTTTTTTHANNNNVPQQQQQQQQHVGGARSTTSFYADDIRKIFDSKCLHSGEQVVMRRTTNRPPTHAVTARQSTLDSASPRQPAVTPLATVPSNAAAVGGAKSTVNITRRHSDVRRQPTTTDTDTSPIPPLRRHQVGDVTRCHDNALRQRHSCAVIDGDFVNNFIAKQHVQTDAVIGCHGNSNDVARQQPEQSSSSRRYSVNWSVSNLRTVFSKQ